MYRIAIVAVLWLPSIPLCAQWLNLPTPGIPRTADGKPNLSAPAPRTPDGKPDLSGVWAAEAAPASPNSTFAGETFADLLFISKYALNIFADLKPGEAPMNPGATSLVQERTATQHRDSPTSHCLPG